MSSASVRSLLFLDVVKQEMARLNINILGRSELKWKGMGEFNLDDHYIYYCGQESLRRNEVAIIVNKSPKCSTWVQSQKWQNDLFVSKANHSISQQSKSMTSLVAQMVKRLPTTRETWVWSLGWEDLLEKEMATHSSTLAWKIPRWRSLVGCSPWGCKESDTTERYNFHFHWK